MTTPPLPREDFEAALAARTELGPGLEPELVESFVDKVESALIARGQQQVQPTPPVGIAQGGRIAVAIVSVVMAIPLTAISLGTGSIVAMIICWIGLVGVNYALRGPDERR